MVGSHAAIGSWNIHDAVMLETSRSLSGISFFMACQAFRYSIRNHMQMDKTVRLHAYIDKKFPNISAHTHTLSLEVCSHTLHCTGSTCLHWHSLASRKAHSDFPGGLLQHLFTLMSQKWSSSLPFQQLGQPAFWHRFKGLVLLTVPTDLRSTWHRASHSIVNLDFCWQIAAFELLPRVTLKGPSVSQPLRWEALPFQRRLKRGPQRKASDHAKLR